MATRWDKKKSQRYKQVQYGSWSEFHPLPRILGIWQVRCGDGRSCAQLCTLLLAIKVGWFKRRASVWEGLKQLLEPCRAMITMRVDDNGWFEALTDTGNIFTQLAFTFWWLWANLGRPSQKNVSGDRQQQSTPRKNGWGIHEDACVTNKRREVSWRNARIIGN